MSKVSKIGMVHVAGAPYEVGYLIGVAGRDATQEIVTQTDAWHEITGPSHRNTVEQLAQYTRARFPEIWAEIEGLAAGLGLPVQSVFAWNCRGDLISAGGEGCTTVVMPGEPTTIAHNEDGMPSLNGHCFMADVQMDSAASYLAFCYPGSLPGHTFAINNLGIYQAVNNLRIRSTTIEMPRMVLGRAVLGCTTLESAVDLLRTDNRSGGFHFTLGQASQPAPLSIEFGGGQCHVAPITAGFAHANHALSLFESNDRQLITDSSAARQQRADALIHQGELNCEDIVRDKTDGHLPILRSDPLDPDGENTLATAVMQISGTAIVWSVYEQSGKRPVHAGRILASE
ncbi:MAG: 6-aminopenicillanic acid acyl-transferase [Gammaproteobacteria bacterium]|nr:6-aminopenicillanic acid acyl-transferase [Gammaproteobacteria bacterium]